RLRRARIEAVDALLLPEAEPPLLHGLDRGVGLGLGRVGGVGHWAASRAPGFKNLDPGGLAAGPSVPRRERRPGERGSSCPGRRGALSSGGRCAAATIPPPARSSLR